MCTVQGWVLWSSQTWPQNGLCSGFFVLACREYWAWQRMCCWYTRSLYGYEMCSSYTHCELNQQVVFSTGVLLFALIFRLIPIHPNPKQNWLEVFFLTMPFAFYLALKRKTIVCGDKASYHCKQSCKPHRLLSFFTLSLCVMHFRYTQCTVNFWGLCLYQFSMSPDGYQPDDHTEGVSEPVYPQTWRTEVWQDWGVLWQLLPLPPVWLPHVWVSSDIR